MGDRVLGPKDPEEELRDGVAAADHAVGNIEEFLAGNEVDRDIVAAGGFYAVLNVLVHDQKIALF